MLPSQTFKSDYQRICLSTMTDLFWFKKEIPEFLPVKIKDKAYLISSLNQEENYFKARAYLHNLICLT